MKVLCRKAFRASICGSVGPLLLSAPGPVCGAPGGRRTVFYRIGAGENRFSADTAALDRPRRHDRSMHLPVSGQDGGTEVFADQGGRNHLRAGVSIIQQEAIAAVAVGAQTADELFHPPKLPLVHAGQLTHCRTPACNWSAPHRPPVPPWHRRFSRFSPRNSR